MESWTQVSRRFVTTSGSTLPREIAAAVGPMPAFDGGPSIVVEASMLSSTVAANTVSRYARCPDPFSRNRSLGSKL